VEDAWYDIVVHISRQVSMKTCPEVGITSYDMSVGSRGGQKQIMK
jgi:hypothetical protein